MSSGPASTPASTPRLRDDSAVSQSQRAVDEAEMIGSLGDALAGVNLGFHPPSNTTSSSAAVTTDEKREPSSSSSAAANPFNVGGTNPAKSSANTGGWGGFSNPDASRNSFARPSSDSRDDSTRNSSHPVVEPSTPERGERKQSIDLFLSRSPSQVLGNDVFKLSTGNLPGLAIPEEPGIRSKGTAVGGQGTGGSPLHGNYDNPGIRSNQDKRRGSPSSNVTGATVSTTTASRSNSPYESGNTAGRTIQAYHGYDQQVKNDSMNGQAGSYHQSMTPVQGSVSNHLENGASPRLHSPYSNNNFNVNSGNSMGFNQYDTTPGGSEKQSNQMAQTGNAPSGAQPQQQVFYMMVPTPDGRGQILQPVQIMQMPGTMQGALPTMQGGGQPMMVMPTVMAQQGQMASPQQGMQSQNNGFLNGPIGGSAGGRSSLIQDKSMGLGGYPTSPADANPYTSPVSGGLGIDDYGQGGGLGMENQYMNQPTDPSLAALYSTPQRPPLDALLGQIRRLSRDQVGCRLVQQALDEEGPMAATLILNEGLPFWGEAMVDPFGNYLFQKILDKITPDERVMLVKGVSTRLVNASLNLHGTRSVQKIVELCAIDEENKAMASATDSSSVNSNQDETAADVLTKALTPAAARLCIDSHGNHVIQRILLKLGPKHSRFVFDAVAESVGDVARHRHGCCVIQRCLDSQAGQARSHLVSRIVDKSLELMQDAYGNYVVQYVLDVCSDEDVHAVCESVIGKVSLLAIQKFSSNVMEKCLERCNDRVKEHYMAELSDPERIRELMMDPFGNYVVQRALSVATHAQAIRLVEAMRPHLISQAPGTPSGQRNGGVRNTAGGRRIMAKICRRFPNFNLNATGTQEEIYSQNRRQHHNPHHNSGATLTPVYGLSQISPTPIQILQQQPLQQQQQRQQTQVYGNNVGDYTANSLTINPINLGGFQFDQNQSYYDFNADAGYFQQQQQQQQHQTPNFGQGAYQSGM